MLALRAEYHESGSLSSMEARRSKPDLSLRLFQSRRSQVDPIPAFYPIDLSGKWRQEKWATRTCLVAGQGRVDDPYNCDEFAVYSTLSTSAMTNDVQSGWSVANTENPVCGVRACSNASSLNAAGVGSCLLATEGTGMTIPATGLNDRR